MGQHAEVASKSFSVSSQIQLRECSIFAIFESTPFTMIHGVVFTTSSAVKRLHLTLNVIKITYSKLNLLVISLIVTRKFVTRNIYLMIYL